MDSLLLKEELQSRFDKPVDIQEYGIADLDRIIKLLPKPMWAIGLNVWGRIVYCGLNEVNIYAIEEYVAAEDPRLFEEIGKIIEQDVIKDIYLLQAQVQDSSLPYATVAQVLAARVYPNDLHFADVTFTNPYRPIAPEKRKFTYQEYEGLGLLGTVIDRIEKEAVSESCYYLTLTAAAIDLVPLFSQYGFTVENSPIAEMGLENGQCIPMEKRIGELYPV